MFWFFADVYENKAEISAWSLYKEMMKFSLLLSMEFIYFMIKSMLTPDLHTHMGAFPKLLPQQLLWFLFDWNESLHQHRSFAEKIRQPCAKCSDTSKYPLQLEVIGNKVQNHLQSLVHLLTLLHFSYKCSWMKRFK